jgi:hypothetical protein
MMAEVTSPSFSQINNLAAVNKLAQGAVEEAFNAFILIGNESRHARGKALNLAQQALDKGLQNVAGGSDVYPYVQYDSPDSRARILALRMLAKLYQYGVLADDIGSRTLGGPLFGKIQKDAPLRKDDCVKKAREFILAAMNLGLDQNEAHWPQPWKRPQNRFSENTFEHGAVGQTTKQSVHVVQDINCGCPARCTQVVLSRMAGIHTCAERIIWLMSVAGGNQSEWSACIDVAQKEYPSQCGRCYPTESVALVFQRPQNRFSENAFEHGAKQKAPAPAPASTAAVVTPKLPSSVRGRHISSSFAP